MDVLTVTGLRVFRGRRSVLDGCELRLAAGETRLLVGASGAGKSTLLRVIAGLEVPDAGRVSLGDRLASGAGRTLVPPHRRGIAMTFQDGALWPHLTLEGHLRFGLNSHVPDRVERDGRVDRVLHEVGLNDRRSERPSHLSGGERQRLGLARALVRTPKLLLLDEPLAHVDLHAQRGLGQVVSEWIREYSMAALWVTHRPGEVAFVKGSVSVMAGGRIVREVKERDVPAWLEEVGSR